MAHGSALGVGEDTPADGRQLREGHDFCSREELLQAAAESAAIVRQGLDERLAAVLVDEVRWLRMTRELPGGLPWDRQPAWRVRLWELLMDEQERVTVAAEMMRVE